MLVLDYDNFLPSNHSSDGFLTKLAPLIMEIAVYFSGDFLFRLRKLCFLYNALLKPTYTILIECKFCNTKLLIIRAQNGALVVYPSIKWWFSMLK